MIGPMSDRTLGHRAATAPRRSDKPILRIHLAEMARSVYRQRQRQSPRGVAAADMFVARRYGKR